MANGTNDGGVVDQATVDKQPTDGQQDPRKQPAADAGGGGKGKQEWDVTRQYRDELAAANRREGEARARAEQLEKRLQTTESAVEDMRRQQASASEPDPDYDDYDNLKTLALQLRDEVKATKSQLFQASQANQTLQERMQQRDQELQNQQRAQDGQRALDETCAALDKEFGAEHRNVVLEQVTQEFAEQEVAKMNQKAQAGWVKKALRLAYIEAAGQKSGSGAKPTKSASQTTKREQAARATVDTGSGGSPPSDEIKPGTVREVKAQLDARNARMGLVPH